MLFSLKLLGGTVVEGESGPVGGPAVQRHRLALLAVLALSRARGVSRDKLMAWLWPERDAERARQLLNQAVHALRRALGTDAVLTSGDDLQLNTAAVSCDVIVFEDALAGGELRQAVGLYAGPFLDGFFLNDAPEFERWVDRERDRLGACYAKALEGLAGAAERAGDLGAAVEWWKARAAHDPYDSRVALRLMQALERAGNRAGALQHARMHEQLLRQDLALEASADVVALAERLRQERASAFPLRQRVESPDVVSAAPSITAKPARVESTPSRRWSMPSVAVGILLAGLLAIAVLLASRRDRPVALGSPAVVDEIAQAVAREIDRRERGDTARVPPQYRTRSIPAYELYLRGSDATLLRSDSGARQGLEYFRRAVALDSTYAAAWAGLARMTIRVAGDGRSAPAARAAAEAATRRALALDDSLAEGHAILGALRSMAYDFADAERHFRRAIALEPDRARHREWIASFYVQIGRPADALVEAERALALDPLSPTATAEVSRALFASRRCDEALARLDAIEALDPPLLRTAPIAARCYAQRAMWSEAVALLRPQARNGERLSAALLGYMLARAGHEDEARAIQADLLHRYHEGSMGAYYLAYVPAALGEPNLAAAWLDSSFADGSLSANPGGRVGLIDPLFDGRLPASRLASLRRRLGLQNR